MVSAKSLANLKKIKKGEIKNPNGRPKGSVSFKTVLNKYLDAKIKVIIDGKVTEVPARQAMSLGLIRDAVLFEKGKIDGVGRSPVAVKDRHHAFELISNRTDGKPVQPLSATSGSDIHLQVSSLEKDAL